MQLVWKLNSHDKLFINNSILEQFWADQVDTVNKAHNPKLENNSLDSKLSLKVNGGRQVIDMVVSSRTYCSGQDMKNIHGAPIMTVE